MRGFILGIVFTLVVIAVGGYFGAINGLVPADADSPPSGLESMLAHKGLRATINRETKGLTDPVAVNDASLLAGVKLYAANCAICHGAADGNQSKLSQGFYIEAPQLAKDGVTDDPEAETYWKVTHGIRFTGMPAYTKTLTETERWQVTQFVAHMDKLPAAVDAAWKAVPSVGDAAAPRNASSSS